MSATLELFAPSGLALTVQLYPYGSDTIANGAGGDALTEATNRKGLYTATIAEAITGWHTAHVFLSGTVIAAGDVYLVAGATCRVRDHDPRLSTELAALAVVPTAAVGATPADGDLTIIRGDAFSGTVSDVLHLVGRTYLWFSMKSAPAREADAEAKIQITEDAGLLIVLGDDYATTTDGSLTVDEGAGTVTIVLEAAVTALLSSGQQWSWDLQILDGNGRPQTVAEGKVSITADVTRAIAEPAPEA